jgi:23S rRNA (adenine2503-C2)-methyltransferase
MPQTRRWPIASLMEVLRDDARRTGRHHFLEYVLIDGLNDSDDDARRLVELARDLPCRVNLIPHNRIAGSGSGSRLAPSPPERVARFRSIVAAGGVRCLVRAPRGPEIDAACGQLARRGA